MPSIKNNHNIFQAPELKKEHDDNKTKKKSKFKVNAITKTILEIARKISDFSLRTRKIKTTTVKSFFSYKATPVPRSSANTKENSMSDHKETERNKNALPKETLGKTNQDKLKTSSTNNVTKLAEILNEGNDIKRVVANFRAIYDNEWTNALDNLMESGISEEKACRCLNDTVIAVNGEMKNKKMDIVNDTNFQKKLNKKGALTKELVYNSIFNKTEPLTIKDKFRVNDQVSSLMREYNVQRTGSDPYSDYVYKLQDVLMEMQLANPPITLEVLNNNDNISTKEFTYYTTSGNVASHSIWPAVTQVVESKKEILIKGVVQPKSENVKSKPAVKPKSHATPTKPPVPPLKPKKNTVNKEITNTEKKWPTYKEDTHEVKIVMGKLHKTDDFISTIEELYSKADYQISKLLKISKNKKSEPEVKVMVKKLKSQLDAHTENAKTMKGNIKQSVATLFGIAKDASLERSRIASTTMFTKNSDVTDLNDSFRAMKLAEMYASLETEESTELLFQVFDDYPDISEFAIEKMFCNSILKSFEFAKQKVPQDINSEMSQTEKYKKVISGFNKNNNSRHIGAPFAKYHDSMLAKNIKEELKITNSSDALDNIINAYVDKLETIMTLIHCHDIPLCLRIQNSGETINSLRFNKKDNTNNNTVNFCAWPAILISDKENAAVMGKGIIRIMK